MASCKFCQQEIIWIIGSSKPYNPDKTAHNCRKLSTSTTKETVDEKQVKEERYYQGVHKLAEVKVAEANSLLADTTNKWELLKIVEKHPLIPTGTILPPIGTRIVGTTVPAISEAALSCEIWYILGLRK